MKKLLFIICLFASYVARSQEICLRTACFAAHVHTGDTVTIGGILTGGNGVLSLTAVQSSGPNASVVTGPLNGWKSGVSDTIRYQVTNLVPGTYLYKLVATDLAGGSMPGVDSIIVTAAAAACPPPVTVTGITVVLFGITITVPPLSGTKVALSNGTTQAY